jgi:hypothetical protein
MYLPSCKASEIPGFPAVPALQKVDSLHDIRSARRHINDAKAVATRQALIDAGLFAPA